MQNAMSLSYLSSKTPDELEALLEVIVEPSLRAQLLNHVNSCRVLEHVNKCCHPRARPAAEAATEPALAVAPTAAPAATAPAAAPAAPAIVEELSDDEAPPPAAASRLPLPPPKENRESNPQWRETPLLSTHALQAVLPAVAPDARRWLHEVQAGSRGAAQQQRMLKELGNFAVRSERARSTGNM